MVHERFTVADVAAVRAYRLQTPGVQILAHPECPPDVLAEADYVGLDGGHGRLDRQASVATGGKVVMVTECSMADNVAVALRRGSSSCAPATCART